MPRIETFVLGPSSPEISTCAKWRVEAFGDIIETGIEAERKSLEAFTSDQSGQAAVVAKLDGILAGTCLWFALNLSHAIRSRRGLRVCTLPRSIVATA